MIATTLIDKKSTLPFGVFVFSGLFVFIWIWLVFGELRKKAIKIKIKGNEVLVANYFGFGFRSRYDYSQFDGFTTAILPSTYDSYEYLYLMKDGKKVIIVSQFYHGNYEELKNSLTDTLPNLGRSKVNIFTELKEIFV